MRVTGAIGGVTYWLVRRIVCADSPDSRLRSDLLAVVGWEALSFDARSQRVIGALSASNVDGGHSLGDVKNRVCGPAPFGNERSGFRTHCASTLSLTAL